MVLYLHHTLVRNTSNGFLKTLKKNWEKKKIKTDQFEKYFALLKIQIPLIATH